ncbi:UNVERIFIED_CONTAM: restriction endonuclease subunit S [Ralstonia mannitolilytica]
MQRYEEYKDSGIEWLGKAPSHWNTEKGKWLFIKNERPILPEYDIITCFRDGHVTLRKNRREEGFTNSLKEIGYQGVLKGDLVIHQMDAFAGAIGVSDSDGKSTPVYSICTPRFNNVSNYYYAYLLRNMALSGFITSLGKGIRERSTDFRFNDFANLVYPLPPLNEQETIAKFLDNKCQKVDATIITKEQQIEKLKELRQVTIHQAVTKGIQSNMEMINSDIDWIGEIPKHWKIKRLGAILKPYSQKNRQHLQLLSITRELGVIVRDIEDQESNHNFIPDDLSGYKHVKVGQFAMNKMKAWQGSYGVSEFEGIVSPAYFIFDIIHNLYGSFFSWAIRSKTYVPFFGKASDGIRIGQWDLSIPRMKEIKFIIPPIEEQKEIVNYLEKQTAKIDRAINQKTEQIIKLKEYKQSLINEVVTGKIKVI